MAESTMHGQSSSEDASCYNCGQAGHWAIACPEPTRPVPAGVEAALASRQGTGQGTSPGGVQYGARKKGPGPVITRYGPPPGAYPSHQVQPPYPGPPPPNYPPFQPPLQYGGGPGYPPVGSPQYGPPGAQPYPPPNYYPPPGPPSYLYSGPSSGTPGPPGHHGPPVPPGMPPGPSGVAPPPPPPPPSHGSHMGVYPTPPGPGPSYSPPPPPPPYSTPPSLPQRPNTFPPPLPPSSSPGPYHQGPYGPRASHPPYPGPPGPPGPPPIPYGGSHGNKHGPRGSHLSSHNGSWNQKSQGPGLRDSHGHNQNRGQGKNHHNKKSNHGQSHPKTNYQGPPNLPRSNSSRSEAANAQSPKQPTPSKQTAAKGTKGQNGTPSRIPKGNPKPADLREHSRPLDNGEKRASKKRARGDDEARGRELHENKKPKKSSDVAMEKPTVSGPVITSNPQPIIEDTIERKLRELGVTGQPKPVETKPGFYPIYKPDQNTPNSDSTQTSIGHASPLNELPILRTRAPSPLPAKTGTITKSPQVFYKDSRKSPQHLSRRSISPAIPPRASTPFSDAGASDTSSLDPLEAELLGLANPSKKEDKRPKARKARPVDNAYRLVQQNMHLYFLSFD
ncbi:hypothetical protein MKZ38_008685 [Zalerion maritima]|uniref:CCHC-type domain-containing protein n=1 Tax=Zalerion maritima TaxID=339359 RepID=A0AAD5RGI8_9PEZI|nr:hypothetical protein MKZ38_008685 [Zalerion maritima]